MSAFILLALLGVLGASAVFLEPAEDGADEDTAGSENDDLPQSESVTDIGELLDGPSVGLTSGEDGPASDAMQSSVDGADYSTEQIEAISTQSSDPMVVEGSASHMLDWDIYYMGDGWFEAESMNSDSQMTEVDGSSGDDYIEVSGSGVYVNAGEGRDVILTENLEVGIVEAGAGDTVFGSNAGKTDNPYDLCFTLNGDAQFNGGTAAEFVVAKGDGGSVYGGGGNDFILSSGGFSHLDGGAGDDVIHSFENVNETSGGTRVLEIGGDEFLDTIFGGDGDDILRVSNGDWVSGGTGGDRFEVYFNCDFETGAVIIDDMDPSKDKVIVTVNANEIYEDENFSDPIFDLTSRLNVVVEGEDTIVYLDDRELLVIKNAVDISVGFSSQSGYAAENNFDVEVRNFITNIS